MKHFFEETRKRLRVKKRRTGNAEKHYHQGQEMTSENVTRNSEPNVLAASGWMLGLSLALIWLPLFGPLIAGFVGGRKAGGVGHALFAVFLPGIVVGILSLFLGTLLSAIPLIGWIFAAAFGTAGVLVSVMQVIPLLIGAALGAWTAK